MSNLNMKINYLSTADILNIAEVRIAGRIDLEKLITSCSGLLCRVANLLRTHDDRIEKHIQAAIGY